MIPSEYNDYESWKDWKYQTFGKFNVDAAKYFADEISRAGISNLKGKNVFELGFGNGSFAGWAKQQGAVYAGTEVIPDLIKRALTEGYNVYSADRALSELAPINSIDLLIAIDVFEHIEINVLRELVLQIRESLKPGGLVIARVPSGDSPFSRAIQHGDLTHRTILGSSSVYQLASESGLSVIAIREPSFPLTGAGVIAFVRRSMIVACRRLIYPLIIKLFMGGGSLVLTPNLIFVFKKK